MLAFVLKAVLVVFAQSVFAETGPLLKIQNLQQIEEQIALNSFFAPGIKAKQKVKVAIFDNGFRFAQEQVGKSLPSFTQIHRGPIPLEGEEDSHGFYMAKILWDLLSREGSDNRYEPMELHLFYTFGYSNFAFAVQEAARRKIDLVLYSQTWEYGGNFDGGGFVNSLVNLATKAGVFWINNAGNFGLHTYNSSIIAGRDEWVRLPGANESLELRCEENPQGSCAFRAVLSWNQFSDDVNLGTDKDLDFVLCDDLLNILQKSTLVQKKVVNTGEIGVSKYPREIITTELKPGKYFLRVKIKSKNFNSQDRLRITTSAEFIHLSHFDNSESLLPPADNAKVLTVGALDSERSGVSIKLQKPDLWTPSWISLSTAESFKGSSNSAAIVAAGLVVLMSQKGIVDKNTVLSLLQNPQMGRSPGPLGRGLSLVKLEFYSTESQGCFRPVNLKLFNMPHYLQLPLQQGGVLVETSAGFKVFFENDPIFLTPYQKRNAVNDIIGFGPLGVGIFPREAQSKLPWDFYEILQTPESQHICNLGFDIQPRTGKVFRLPQP